MKSYINPDRLFTFLFFIYLYIGYSSVVITTIIWDLGFNQSANEEGTTENVKICFGIKKLICVFIWPCYLSFEIKRRFFSKKNK